MDNPYSSLCDEFFINMTVNTELDMPGSKDTILSFFERLERQYPEMVNFYRRDIYDYYLEQTGTSGLMRSVNLEIDRIRSSVANPIKLEDGYEQHMLILELMPYMLSVSHLDVSMLDLTFRMDFDYYGNHDEVISEALFSSTAFNSLLDIEGSTAVGFSPKVTIALSDDYRSQAKIEVKSKTSLSGPLPIKSSKFDHAISLEFTIRQFPPSRSKFDPLKSFAQQQTVIEELMSEKIVPFFVKPLNEVITQKGLS